MRRECVECGVFFTLQAKGRTRIYCGKACKQRAMDRRKIERHTRSCCWCGQPFNCLPHSPQQVCSTQCSVNLRRSLAGELVSPWPRVTCTECGDPISPTRKTCPGPCTTERNRRHQREWNQANRPTIPKAYDPRPCDGCATPFTPLASTHHYCSAGCANRTAKDRRRTAKSAAFVERVYRAKVYERDGWCCQLCGRKVNRNAVVPHPNAPTLDHILPLSKGGTHEYANVQLAHFLCNSLKSDGGTDQLRLVG